MKTSRKFSHFELFKVVINTAYITSGLIMFMLWCSNVSAYVEDNYYQHEIMCENCDEID